MATLYVLMGLPGSGKSTFAKKFGYPVVSSDAIRKELYGDESIQRNPNKIFAILYNRVHEYLQNDISCIYDATNIQKAHRLKIINSFPEADSKVLIYLNRDIETCITNDGSRQRIVGKDVIRTMSEKLEFPSLKEGWDKIIFI